MQTFDRLFTVGRLAKPMPAVNLCDAYYSGEKGFEFSFWQ